MASTTPGGLAAPVRRTRPEAGDIVQVRHRHYLVEEAVPPTEPDEASRIVLVGLDDDNQGRRLEVLWEIELGARILQPELHGPDTRGRLDPPRAFAAYLNALRWNAVTATNAERAEEEKRQAAVHPSKKTAKKGRGRKPKDNPQESFLD